MTTDFDVITLGEALVSFRHAGLTSFPYDSSADIAGAESNVAIGLARLGHRVQWISRVSTDQFGDAALKRLRAEDVDLSRVVRDPSPTGLMFLDARTRDLRTVQYRRSDSAATHLAESDVADLGYSRFVHVSGITPALSDSARRTTFAFIANAKKTGAKVSLDLNYRQRLWAVEEASDILKELAQHADVVIGGADELAMICAEPQDLLSESVGLVVRKLGSAGAEAWRHDGHCYSAAFAVASADPVGAGDGFVAGLLSGLLDDLDLAAILERANQVGAFAVASDGDWQGYPSKAELHLLGGADVQR